jgi:hypothetical protein
MSKSNEGRKRKSIDSFSFEMQLAARLARRIAVQGLPLEREHLA